MNETLQERLIDRILNSVKVSLEQRREIFDLKNKSMEELEAYVTQKKLMDSEELTRFKGEIMEVPYMNLFGVEISHQVFEFLPIDIVENYKMVCFEREGLVVQVGMVNPEDFQAIEALDFISKKYNIEVHVHIISKNSFDSVLHEYTTLREEVAGVMDVASEKFEERFQRATGNKEEMEAVLKEAPVTKIVSVIIKHAVEGRASDIHIEPVHKKTRVRYRIDGILRNALFLPKYLHSALVARVKVMANLKLDETRIPQDGRMRVVVEDKEVDFRVSTLPLFEQEKVVLRILETSNIVPSLLDLGFHENNIVIIENNLRRTHGIFLATGPTGSGKSTTLYSILNVLNKEGVNIVTLEDPIEYYMDGVNQSQVRGEVNYDFASGLRSILRQDPNIVMVGEIRDRETASMAVNAGLTGHLLFSTIHTNNAIGAVPRLIDMGVEPFLIASTLNLVIAQRLTRKICQNCRKEIELPNDLAERIKNELETLPTRLKDHYGDLMEEFHVFIGTGCPMCHDTGYRGRVAIAEVLQVSENLQQIIYNGYEIRAVQEEIKNQGMISLKQDGILRALEGVTSIQEVLRVTEE